ncbi:MAG: amidophosphoribosyltransferase [Armatimonadetes bacterium]|nr:amidophosphoribosyltransferase [Armatimonadota bacterium]
MTDWQAEDNPKEECGVLGVYSPDEDAARVAFFGLFALQHRGQESAGIAASDGHEVRMHRKMGLVTNVFNDESILTSLPGHLAIGHTRYSTTGASVSRNAQPIFCQDQAGLVAVAHNGNLTNAQELAEELQEAGETLESTSDSELLARMLVRNLDKGIEEAVRVVMRKALGAYSVTVLLPNAVVAFRDPWGVRPLTVGKLNDNGFFFASETCAFNVVGAEPTHELAPGEMAIVENGEMRIVVGVPPTSHKMCLFEFIYFARPDSKMYGELLYRVRERMGEILAEEHPIEADLVIPVPDSGVPAALGFSAHSGIPYREGMMKSRYIHRTFIQPDQRLRELGVRMKLSPLKEHLKGKSIVLVDDSIVRGTTTKQIVKLLRESGAREVHVRITAPPIQFPCFYGVDMATREELASAKMTVEQLREHLGANSLGFLSIAGAARATGQPQGKFCLACFNGKYEIPISDRSKIVQAGQSKDHVGNMVSLTQADPQAASNLVEAFVM